jgi:putative membrane protein
MSQPSITAAESLAAALDAAATPERRMTMSMMQKPKLENHTLVEDHEPDYRFTLANERTFLAWIRTAFALLAGSVAIVQLVPHFSFPDARKILGGLLAVISIEIVLHSAWRWHSVQQAMRRDAPLPSSATVWLLTGGGILVGIIVFVLVISFGIGEN